jgi:hypothetical protein
MLETLTISSRVAQSPARVYSLLETLVSRAEFQDHLMGDWCFSGPVAGAGARATAKMTICGVTDTIEYEIVEAVPARRVVERHRLRRWGRVAEVGYTLGPLLDGGTHISLDFTWVEVPPLERLAAPLVHAAVHRFYTETLRRLGEQLDCRPTPLVEISRADDSLALSSP